MYVPLANVNPLDPMYFTSNMQYLPRLSTNFLKIPLHFGANFQSQSFTSITYSSNNIISFALKNAL